MNRINTALTALITNEDGQGMVEYALVLALVSVVAIATLQALGTNLTAILAKASDALK